MPGALRVVLGGNAIRRRKLATGSGFISVIVAGTHSSGALENIIAPSALLNSSSIEAACWDFDGKADD